MPRKTDDELKQLARDIHAGGRVFTAWNIAVPMDAPVEVQADVLASQIQMIFLPLALISQEQLDRLQTDEPWLFYEYLASAGPRSVNGYPQFMSVQYVVQADQEKLLGYLDALKAAPDPLAGL